MTTRIVSYEQPVGASTSGILHEIQPPRRALHDELRAAEQAAQSSVRALHAHFRSAMPLSDLLSQVDRVFERLEEGNVHLELASTAAHRSHALAHASLARALAEEALRLANPDGPRYSAPLAR